MALSYPLGYTGNLINKVLDVKPLLSLHIKVTKKNQKLFYKFFQRKYRLKISIFLMKFIVKFHWCRNTIKERTWLHTAKLITQSKSRRNNERDDYCNKSDYHNNECIHYMFFHIDKNTPELKWTKFTHTMTTAMTTPTTAAKHKSNNNNNESLFLGF